MNSCNCLCVKRMSLQAETGMKRAVVADARRGEFCSVKPALLQRQLSPSVIYITLADEAGGTIFERRCQMYWDVSKMNLMQCILLGRHFSPSPIILGPRVIP